MQSKLRTRNRLELASKSLRHHGDAMKDSEPQRHLPQYDPALLAQIAPTNRGRFPLPRRLSKNLSRTRHPAIWSSIFTTRSTICAALIQNILNSCPPWSMPRCVPWRNMALPSDSLRVAVLAALNIADELVTLRQQRDSLSGNIASNIKSRTETLAEMLDAVLEENRKAG